jgi:hypothetical protein
MVGHLVTATPLNTNSNLAADGYNNVLSSAALTSSNIFPLPEFCAASLQGTRQEQYLHTLLLSNDHKMRMMMRIMMMS